MARKSKIPAALNTKLIGNPGDFPPMELSSGSDSEGPSDEEKDVVVQEDGYDWGPHHRRPSKLPGHYYYAPGMARIRSTLPPPPPPPPPRQKQSSSRYNRIQLHIYDLIASDTLMQLPWGCICEIGKCFNDVNTALHELGTGAYHVGVDVNGVEYAFGATSVPGKSGVFSCIPKLSPGYQYRTSIDFGNVPLVRTSYVKSSTTSTRSALRLDEYVDGKVVIKEMATEYMGADYNILRRNCCTFAYEACVRLGIPPPHIPSWFRNLAETGAYSQDIANSTIVEPLKRVLSHTKSPSDVFSFFSDDFTVNSVLGGDDDSVGLNEKDGFEMVARRNETNTRDVVVVLKQSEPQQLLPLIRKSRSTISTSF